MKIDKPGCCPNCEAALSKLSRAELHGLIHKLIADYDRSRAYLLKMVLVNEGLIHINERLMVELRGAAAVRRAHKEHFGEFSNV